MIRTLSKALSNTSCSSTESSPPPHSRRFTLHSLARRLSDSKKGFLDQIPHHQEQFTRLRKRAKSVLSSPFTDQLEFEKGNSSSGVWEWKIDAIKISPIEIRMKIWNYLFRSSVLKKFIDVLM